MILSEVLEAIAARGLSYRGAFHSEVEGRPTSDEIGTLVLLEAARKFKTRRFLHVSTDEVYGTLGDEGLFSEETPTRYFRFAVHPGRRFFVGRSWPNQFFNPRSAC